MTEITQADRDAADAWWMHREHDERDLPAYFARHREAAMLEGARLALDAAEFAFVAPGVWTSPWKVIRALNPAEICGLAKKEDGE